MPKSHNRSNLFLIGVAVAFALMSCLAIVQPKAATGKLDAGLPSTSDAVQNDNPASLVLAPKRRPIRAAAGWGEVSGQAEPAPHP